jgi:hypothetical protein
VNTDQAFELLMEAGLAENMSIQTVRRWLREGKINYEGNEKRKTGYIIDDTDQAFDLLKDAGLTKSMSIQTVRRWLHEGKIKYDRTKTRSTEYTIDDIASKLFKHDRTDPNKDEIIHQLKLKIKTQDKHIEGIEEIHRTANNIVIQQRGKLDKLNKEIVILKNETRKLLKENTELHNELIKLKENKRDHFHSTTQSNDYSKKLGLSKMASNKDVLAEYKGLLKITHPDHGGNEKLFHYIKTDYDLFRNNIKGN